VEGRHYQDGEIGALFLQGEVELVAVHLGHHDVGQQRGRLSRRPKLEIAPVRAQFGVEGSTILVLRGTGTRTWP
jgi:hypothetical protein